MTDIGIYDDFLIYHPSNLNQTIRHCSSHNPVLQHKSDEEWVAIFLSRVLEDFKRHDMKPDLFLGQLQPLYNAQYVVDKHEVSAMRYQDRTFGPGRFEVNFFVRLS